MEKFSKWRDPGTGIAPFIPVPSKPITFASVFLFLPRLILFVLLAPFLLLPTPKPPLSLLSVFREFKYDSKNFSRPGGGDVIISNFVSPLDPLIYRSAFPNCLFVIPSQKPHLTSLLGAIRAALGSCPLSPLTPSDEWKSVLTVAKESGRVIVVFAEGTTSNGKGILPFTMDTTLSPDANLFVSALRYTPGSITSPVPVGTFYWVFHLLFDAPFSVKVRISKSSWNSAPTDLASAGRMKLLGPDVSLQNKREFISVYSKNRQLVY